MSDRPVALDLSTAAFSAARERLKAHRSAGKWVTDPAGWTRTRRNAHVWSKQVQILESVRDHTRTAVQSCHGIGKSWTAADIALWWIDSHEPGSAIVVSTAPTYQQVHAILWEEIRKGHRKAGLPGVVLKSDEWQDPTGDIVGFGRKPADTDEHGFQGIHRRYVLVIIDEACGVPKQLFTAAEAIVTNADCRILAIGNPDDPGTEFGQVCRPGSGYNVIRVSAMDTPNFTGETIPDDLAHLLVSQDWVDDKRRRWGTSSPLWKSKVMGEFPEVGEHTLIQPAWITAAQERTLEPSGTKTLGVDVARFGSDQTVIGLRHGGVFRILETMPTSATTTTTGHVVAWQRQHDQAIAQVDGVGVGAGVVDQLREQGAPVADMQAGAAAKPEVDPRTGKEVTLYVNARAQWYWTLRKLFEFGQVDIDPADDELASQLGSLRYELDSKGRIKIESKDDMKARGMPSPDRADSMMLAFGERAETGRAASRFLAQLVPPCPTCGTPVPRSANGVCPSCGPEQHPLNLTA